MHTGESSNKIYFSPPIFLRYVVERSNLSWVIKTLSKGCMCDFSSVFQKKVGHTTDLPLSVYHQADSPTSQIWVAAEEQLLTWKTRVDTQVNKHRNSGNCVCVSNGVLSRNFLFLLWVCLCMKVTQSCLTLCNPMDCSPPRSSVHAILQARILEWVAMPSFRGSSWPREWTLVS